jgi:hypothetical protein
VLGVIGVRVSPNVVLGVVSVRVSAELLRSVGRDGIGLQGSVVLGLGHSVDNLLHLGSAGRGVLPGVVSGSVDVGELALDGVVVLIVLVHISGDTDVSGSGEAIGLVIPRGTTNNSSVSLGSRSVRTATKSDATSARAVVVVLHRSELRLKCGVGLVVRRVGRAVVRGIVRLRVVLDVGLLVVHVVRLRVRFVVRLGVRLIVLLTVRRVVRLGVRLKVGLMVRLEVGLGAREPAPTKGDAASGRAIVVVLHRSELVLECSVGLVVRCVGRAVVRGIVRLRVMLDVGLLVVHVVRLRVRLVVRLGVRLIVVLTVRRVVRLGVRLKVGLVVRLNVPRCAVGRTAKVLRATEGRKAPGVRLGVDILML